MSLSLSDKSHAEVRSHVKPSHLIHALRSHPQAGVGEFDSGSTVGHPNQYGLGCLGCINAA